MLMQGFKKAHVDYYNREVQLPTKKQLWKAFGALKDDRERAIFLLCASSGLRRSELLKLTFDEVDFEMEKGMLTSMLPLREGLNLIARP